MDAPEIKQREPVGDAGVRGKPNAKNRISVLHLIYSPAFGGIETMVLNWVRNFDRSAFDVHLAYFAGDRDREIPFLQAAKRAGIPVLPVRWSKFKPFLKAARDVAQIVRDYEIDIVHTHAYYGDAVGAIAGHLVPVMTVATIYVWTRKYELHRQIMQLIDWIAIQFIDEVTGHCRDTARKTFVIGKRRSEIPALLPGYPDSTAPVSADERRKLREAAGIANDEIVMVNVARIAREKAQDQLLRSFRIIHDRHPRTRLWISGVGLDWLERDLLRLRRVLDLESSVTFLGFTRDVWSLLNTVDFMVHPSHVEGVPAAVLEGMAAGLPIVASAVNGIPEIIDCGRNGILVKENDVRGFADAVMRLIEDRPLALRLGQAARQSIESELSIRAAVSEVERLYRRVLNR